MATRLLGGTDTSVSRDSLTLILTPILLSGEDDGLSSDSLARIGQGVMIRGTDYSSGSDALSRFNLYLRLNGSDSSRGSDSSGVRPPPVGFVDLGTGADRGQIGFTVLLGGTDVAYGSDNGTSWGNDVFLDGFDESYGLDDGAPFTGLRLAGQDASEGSDFGNLGFVMPFLRAPFENEIRGTINLVRNPSLEYEEVGLIDWSSDTEIVLDRSDTVYWDGFWSTLATIDIGVGTPEIVVVSQQGLYLSGALYWVGSFALSGDALSVDYFLRLTYTDTSIDEGEVSTVVPSSDWQLLATESVSIDVDKVLDKIELVLQVAQNTVETTLNIDGVQIEEDKAGGSTPLATGDMGAGYLWYGVPGFSVSVRYPAVAA